MCSSDLEEAERLELDGHRILKLNRKFKTEDFYIPLEYQRNFVWSDEDCSYFIESVLIGLPIPYMFFADTEDGRTENSRWCAEDECLGNLCERRFDFARAEDSDRRQQQGLF